LISSTGKGLEEGLQGGPKREEEGLRQEADNVAIYSDPKI
jgi:hypothetical protein